MHKSSIEEIRKRFDNDVERFSNMETGQKTAIDATLSLELITEAAARISPNATHLLDIGCGAGNYTLKMLEKMNNLNCTLVDLSKPMLEKASTRLTKKGYDKIEIIQGDIRTAPLKENHYDIILAGAVLHHLRDDQDWEDTFTKIYRLLKKGGCLMISDLITQDSQEVNAYIWEKYGHYIETLGGPEYRKKVFAYVSKEDSPRSMTYQLELMKKVGFTGTEILHKNLCFGAFGGIK
jgi:tRNA (cmo5U34)-methyltransferase